MLMLFVACSVLVVFFMLVLLLLLVCFTCCLFCCCCGVFCVCVLLCSVLFVRIVVLLFCFAWLALLILFSVLIVLVFFLNNKTTHNNKQWNTCIAINTENQTTATTRNNWLLDAYQNISCCSFGVLLLLLFMCWMLAEHVLACFRLVCQMYIRLSICCCLDEKATTKVTHTHTQKNGNHKQNTPTWIPKWITHKTAQRTTAKTTMCCHFWTAAVG